jgi:drug/metabolite transporter (DMT)-like permease
MSFYALGLLLISALIHMGWNLLVKQAEQRHLITWWGLVVGALCFAPWAWVARAELAQVWVYALVSGIFQLLYYLILGYAYNRGDFSLVYPVARGSAPIFIACWSVIFLHEQIRGVGLLGLITVVVGLIIIGVGAWQNVQQNRLHLAGLVAPFAIALTISGYSVIDGAAVDYVAPFPYTVLGFMISALLLSPVMVQRYGWGTITAVLQAHWRRISVVGLSTYAAYGLVLTAYALAQVSYVGAVREISIVFAALAGWLWLGEPFGLARTLGAAVVCAGIFLVTLA